MPTLADIQQRVRRAVVHGDCQNIGLSLVGSSCPEQRLAIHRRHYEASLLGALLGKFPATAWLIGSELLIEATRAFIRTNPPTAPCIAEYGADFPQFLPTYPGAGQMPYLFGFSQLEWHLGQVSVAVDAPSVSIDVLSRIDRSLLVDVKLAMQPCVRYLKTSWPVDTLMSLFLSDGPPKLCTLTAAETWLEVRGSRGDFSMKRLSPAEFEFRRAVTSGRTVGIAAELALQCDPAFDLTVAFSSIFSERLVVSVS